MANKNEDKITMSKVRILPNNFEAEQSLLCCMLISGNIVNDIVTQLDAEAFYSEVNRKIYEAIIKVNNNLRGVDIISVNDMMIKEKTANENTLNYLYEINTLLPSSANYKTYQDIIYRDMILRKLIIGCNNVVEEAYFSKDEKKTLSSAENMIYGLSKKLSGETGLSQITKPANDVIEKINVLARDKNALRGLPTGFRLFDKITNGLQNGALIILAARPSVGKTAFAFNIVANAFMTAKEKRTIAIFSLEMPAVELAQRLMCNLADVTMDSVNDGSVDTNGLRNLWKVTQTLSDSKIFIDDSSMVTPSEIFSQCRRLPSIAGSNRVDLIVIDYLQLMTADKSAGRRPINSRQEEVAEMSRMMKVLAKEMNCPVVLLSQMSRGIENRQDKTPMLSDLRESGSIEQDADIVMFLSREGEKTTDIAIPQIINLDITKHRNGRLDKIILEWRGDYMRFVESEKNFKSANQQNITQNQ